MNTLISQSLATGQTSKNLTDVSASNSELETSIAPFLGVFDSYTAPPSKADKKLLTSGGGTNLGASNLTSPATNSRTQAGQKVLALAELAKSGNHLPPADIASGNLVPHANAERQPSAANYQQLASNKDRVTKMSAPSATLQREPAAAALPTGRQFLSGPNIRNNKSNTNLATNNELDRNAEQPRFAATAAPFPKSPDLIGAHNVARVEPRSQALPAADTVPSAARGVAAQSSSSYLSDLKLSLPIAPENLSSNAIDQRSLSADGQVFKSTTPLIERELVIQTKAGGDTSGDSLRPLLADSVTSKYAPNAGVTKEALPTSSSPQDSVTNASFGQKNAKLELNVESELSVGTSKQAESASHAERHNTLGSAFINNAGNLKGAVNLATGISNPESGAVGFAQREIMPGLELQNQPLKPNYDQTPNIALGSHTGDHLNTRISPTSNLGVLNFADPQFPRNFNEQVFLMAGQGVQRAHLSLNPQDLGPIEIRLAIQKEEISIQLASQNVFVRDALEQNLPRLRDMFEQTGMKLAEHEITSDIGGDGEFRPPNERQRDNARNGFESANLKDEQPIQQVHQQNSLVDTFI